MKLVRIQAQNTGDTWVNLDNVTVIETNGLVVAFHLTSSATVRYSVKSAEDLATFLGEIGLVPNTTTS